MIDTITVPLAQFDFEVFLEGYQAMYRSWSDDTDAIDQSVPAARRFGDPPVSIEGDRHWRKELCERGWLLFFQMHEPLADETALCIDGTREATDDFDINVGDGYGFLVEVRDGIVHLHPALYDGSSGPVPSLDLQAHCSVLDEKMRRFAESCVRTG